MSTTLLPILGASFVIMLASLAGAIFAWKMLGDWLKPRLLYMVALATGIFTVIVYGLLEEAFHEGVSVETGIAFLLGAVLLQIATMLLPKNSHHHHHGACNHSATPIDARRVLIGDAMHNVHDGLVLVPAFLVSPMVGYGTAFGIFLHEIVQEIAEFFVLRSAGYGVRKALTLNFLVSSSILAGSILSWWLASSFDLERNLVALSAGGFTYIIVRDLIPSIVRDARKTKRYAEYVISAVLGAVLMYTVMLLLPGHNEYDAYPLPEGFGLAVTIEFSGEA